MKPDLRARIDDEENPHYADDKDDDELEDDAADEEIVDSDLEEDDPEDYPNQINNVLAFPGVFRGALDARATAITEEMKLAAARGIASTVLDDELDEDDLDDAADEDED